MFSHTNTTKNREEEEAGGKQKLEVITQGADAKETAEAPAIPNKQLWVT